MDPLTMMAIGKARQMAGNADAANSEVRKANKIIAAKNQTIDELVAEIERLKWELLLETAHAAGMKADRDELRRGAPNNPALAPSGERYKNGNPKSWAGVMYAREFDRILREARIPNPAQYRD